MILAKNALQRDVKALNRSKQLASSERENKARIVRLKEAAANELIDVEDELENALNVSDITENKSTEIDALTRELEIETQRLSNKVADVQRMKRATKSDEERKGAQIKEYPR